MIVALLILIAILLMPGGAPFVARLWSAVCVAIGLAATYVLWGNALWWVMGAIGAVVLATFAYMLIHAVQRPRKRPFTGGR